MDTRIVLVIACLAYIIKGEQSGKVVNVPLNEVAGESGKAVNGRPNKVNGKMEKFGWLGGRFPWSYGSYGSYNFPGYYYGQGFYPSYSYPYQQPYNPHGCGCGGGGSIIETTINEGDKSLSPPLPQTKKTIGLP